VAFIDFTGGRLVVAACRAQQLAHPFLMPQRALS